MKTTTSTSIIDSSWVVPLTWTLPLAFLPPLSLKWSGRPLSFFFLLEHLRLHRQVPLHTVGPFVSGEKFCGEHENVWRGTFLVVKGGSNISPLVILPLSLSFFQSADAADGPNSVSAPNSHPGSRIPFAVWSPILLVSVLDIFQSAGKC